MTENYKIAPIREEEMEELVELVNSAYRGEVSKKGWTTEADLIEGSSRTDLHAINEMLKRPGATIFTCRNEKALLGCVYLKQDKSGLYLGMLSVSPVAQGLGIGKKILAAAEDHAKKMNCNYIVMTVIDVRHELIAWYERHGYKRTGETKPFIEDEAFGKPKQPLTFIILKKMINA